MQLSTPYVTTCDCVCFLCACSVTCKICGSMHDFLFCDSVSTSVFFCIAHYKHIFRYSRCILCRQRKKIPHQVVIWSDSKQLSEVSEGHGSVGFKPEVWVVVGWREVAAFTVWSKVGPLQRAKRS